MAVAVTIHESGLDGFYRHRQELGKPLDDLDGQAATARAAYDRPEMQARYARSVGPDLSEVTLVIDNLRCAACVWLCEQHLERREGVVLAHVNYATGRARVRWQPSRCTLAGVLDAFAAIGYQAVPSDLSRDAERGQREKRSLLLRMAVAMLGMMQVMMYAWPAYMFEDAVGDNYLHLLRWSSLVLTLPVVFYSASPLIGGAWRSLRNRHLGMDVPVVIGIVAAFSASLVATVTGQGEVYFDSVTMFVALLLAARYVELCARHDARSGAQALATQLPVIGACLPGYPQQREVSMLAVADLLPGQVVRVRPGDAIPVDGVVLEGATDVDESILTGESRPLRRRVGDAVLAGSYNCTSPILLRVTGTGAHTRLAEIARVLDESLEQKPRLAVLADRVAVWFVTGLLTLALLVGLAWWWLDPARALPIMIAVLVVSCPCALSLATPAALAAATGGLARRGVLIVHGHALETLAKVTDVLFDKTGTLTEGRFALVTTQALGPLSQQECLALAGRLETGSNHPVAKAFIDAAAAMPVLTAAHVQAHDIAYVPGRGLQATCAGRLVRLGSREFVDALSSGEPDAPRGHAVSGATAMRAETEIWLGDGAGPLARFILSDTLRRDAREMLRAMADRNLRVHLVSGDDAATVAYWAGSLGIERFVGGATPEQKRDYVARLQADGAVVLAVGDGVNDAPLLGLAQVSIAIGRGAPLAQASADAVLMADGVLGVAAALQAATRTRKVIRQNLGWAMAYNLVFIPLAALGLITAWMAGVGMALSSLLVVGNAWRLRR